MKAQKLRQEFLNFFKKQDHTIVGSASLIPENDPTVLFTTAGMHPLVPYLMGEKHPGGTRLVSVQKCIRTGDIEEVGDATHHTFFEMLGNWSLGDYDEKQAVEWAWEFVIKKLKLDKNKLAISIFGGNQDISEYDKEAESYWLDLGIAPDRITKISDNWWGPAGQTGPCGPDTEIFYWTSSEPVPDKFDEADDRWVEIWNNVFMKYNKTTDNKFEELQQKNIDTGMGLERTLAVLNNLDDNYKTELFWPIIEKIQKLSGQKYEYNTKAFRIIADHIRSAVFMLGDEQAITPSNTDQGYVLRRLIRRAIRFAHQLGIEDNFTSKLAEVVLDIMHKSYPELDKNKDLIISELDKEENKFKQTLQKGLKEFAKQKNIDGKTAFTLFSTYGFPLEMTEELAKENNIKISKADFETEFKKHQELSRTASAGMFKGGLADDSEMTKKYHSVTHLLLQALRDVLGDHVEQRGSNINDQRARFDFSHNSKLTDEQKAKIEEIVNSKIQAALPVSVEKMTLEEADKQGAIGIFKSKYGEKVKVYSMGNYSKEVCGGPHVDNTSTLGKFKIKKEGSSSAGVRRIKAILE